MRTKWIYTILVLALGFFASCNNEVDEAAGNKKTRTVVFRLAVDDAVGSRAGTWGDVNEYTPADGTDMENRIDLKGLRVAIYSIKADGSVNARVGVADHLLYWAINESDSKNPNDLIEYKLVGDISNVPLEKDQEYRFMVYANFPHATNNQFMLDDIGVDNGYIPMWGVITYKVTGAELEDLGTVDLLRAAAKVEVTFADEVKANYAVSGLAIKNYNEKGNNLPTGWDTTPSTKNLNMETCINVTADHVHGRSLSFKDGKSYIYLPEYANTKHDAEDQSVVEVTLTKDGKSKTYEIPFCKFTNAGIIEANSVYDIVRNHIYRFNVIGVKGNNLLLNLEVADWNDKTLLDLGTLAYPTYVNPLLPEKGYDYPKKNIKDEDYIPFMKFVQETKNDKGEVTNNTAIEAAGFTAYFHYIDTNVSEVTGYPWRPNIVGGSSADYKIKVYLVPDSGSEELVYDSSLSSSDQDLKTKYKGWFKIVVIPLNQDKVNTKINLAISSSIHPSGFPSDDFFLFINGENDNIAWPNSGDDRKFIQITQQ